MSTSVYVERRKTSRGSSYRVRYRLGGRESTLLDGGSFRKKGDADAGRWISGEIAAMRVPDLPALAEAPQLVAPLRIAAPDYPPPSHPS